MDEEKYRRICEEFGGKYINKNKCLVDGFPLALEEASYLYNYRPESQERIVMSPTLFLGWVFKAPLNEEIVDELKSKIKGGKSLDPLFITVTPSGKILDHEGRHRALSAIASNAKKVPVIIYCRDDETYEFLPKDKCKVIIEKLKKALV